VAFKTNGNQTMQANDTHCAVRGLQKCHPYIEECAGGVWRRRRRKREKRMVVRVRRMLS